MRAALLGILVGLFSCGGSAAKGDAPPPAPQPSPTPPPVPEVKSPKITIVPAEAAPGDCTASPPDGGLLDRTSSAFSKIEVKANAQWISEKAWLADSTTIVTASIGGCSHFGASYVVELESTTSVDDRAAHLLGALDIVNGLPKRDGADTYLKEIGEEIDKAKDQPKKLSECDFPRGEIDRVLCEVGNTDDGRISVTLAYDVAL